MEFDRVRASLGECRGEVQPHGVELSIESQSLPAEENLVDLQLGVEIELDPGVISEHAETYRVLSADDMTLGIHADVQVIGDQIVVGTVAPVLAPQNVRPRGRSLGILRA